MSIQSEISRISEAKSDIVDAIETKGVEVPATAKIDEYAQYVLQIEIWPNGDNIGYGTAGGSSLVGSAIVGTAIAS